MHQLEVEREDTATGRFAVFREICHRNVLLRLGLCCALFVFMIMSGSNAINFFSPRIFGEIGITGDTSQYVIGIYGIVRFITVVITMAFLIDRIGRKKLLLCGSIILSTSMWYIGGYVIASDSKGGMSASGIVAVVFIMLVAIGLCCSWGGIPWIIAAEVFPLRVRSVCVAICAAVHWLMNFTLARSVPYMISNIGGGTFFIFAGMQVLAFVFVSLFLPETKGIPLETMEELFGANSAEAHQTEKSEEDQGHAEQAEAV